MRIADGVEVPSWIWIWTKRDSKNAWGKLALGSGSGGVKGRRKGMVFKCENCSKVSSND